MPARRTDSPSPSRFRRWGSIAAAVALIAVVTIVPAAGAAASTGSIPPDVIEFAQADNGLITELEEYFGVDERGGGLDFSGGLELGTIDRIFLWSEAYRSGEKTDTPVQYVNRWKVPVLVGDEPVGIAMIGIDPATVEPEMIDFIRSAGTALALDDIDNDATLVYEPEAKAWFSLSEGVIIPLVRGDSGISGATTLAQYQPMLSDHEVDVVEPTPQPDQGSVQSVVLIATTVGVLLLALLVPTVLGQLRERRERQDEVKAEGTGAEAVAVADDEADVDPEAEGDADDESAGETDTDAALDSPALATSEVAPKVPASKKPAPKKPSTASSSAKKSSDASKPAASPKSSATELSAD